VLHPEGAGVHEAELLVYAVLSRPRICLGLGPNLIEGSPVFDYVDIRAGDSPSLNELRKPGCDADDCIGAPQQLFLEAFEVQAAGPRKEASLLAKDKLGCHTVDIL